MKKLRISGALVIALLVLNPISADIPEFMKGEKGDYRGMRGNISPLIFSLIIL